MANILAMAHTGLLPLSTLATTPPPKPKPFLNSSSKPPYIDYIFRFFSKKCSYPQKIHCKFSIANLAFKI